MGKLIEFKNSKPALVIRNKSTTVAEIIIYQEIGRSDFFSDRLSAQDFHNELKKMPDTVNTIEVRINSLGGDVFEGITIYNRLKQHSAKVIVFVDGMAASIASIIAMAGDEIKMSIGSTIMIHKPWTFTGGNARELEDVIDRLNDVEDRLINIYAKKTKLGRDELKTMLANETWFDADQAIENNFATEIIEDEAQPLVASLDKATWITKKPEVKNRGDVVNGKLDQLKKDIKEKIARK